MIELEQITKENLHDCKAFETAYDDHLKVYMSRLHPNSHEEFDRLTKAGLLRWYYIIVDQKRVGSIWLEKSEITDDSAVLGLFIDDDRCRGKGVGKYVIEHIIDKNAGELNLAKVILRVRFNNPRAIRCYEKCGFHETNRKVGSTGIVGLTMVKEL